MMIAQMLSQGPRGTAQQQAYFNSVINNASAAKLHHSRGGSSGVAAPFHMTMTSKNNNAVLQNMMVLSGYQVPRSPDKTKLLTQKRASQPPLKQIGYLQRQRPINA